MPQKNGSRRDAVAATHSVGEFSQNAAEPTRQPATTQAYIHVELVGDDEARAHRLTARDLCSLARKLIRAGANPASPIEAYRGGTLALWGRSLAEVSALTVEDRPDGRPSFRRYRARVWASPAKTVQNGPTLSGQPCDRNNAFGAATGDGGGP